ncbi:hypothetical protein glysoja_039244 [Glycine soja]|uniref:Neprosin PEP catalytic domain-containing protein n=1 Tax=Glycine soja TaxID=3848 RepID=A0A0B2Q1J8_GLYSO|nr:hypothetical protein glysoja_039244 [Glycine soja]
MINTLLLVMCLVTSGARHKVHGTQNVLQEDLELERQLELLNKPPIKSIHTNLGYIVDCIDINKQPAFDHPLLKNHKLQRKPSFQKSIGKTSVKKSPTRPLLVLQKDQCPTGTVPIRRTTKDDLIREKSFLNYHIMTQDIPGVHIAEVSLSSLYGPYYGVIGSNNVFNPRVSRKDQVSSSHLWVQNGPVEAANKIAAGWHSDNFERTGCYNIRCSGFVQISKVNYLGTHVNNYSTYGGTQLEFIISITQDPVTKNWWLNMANINIGYFPAALFSNMTSADQVGWGGRTRTPPNTPSPPMGSGHFPDHTFHHACYFTFVSFQNEATRNYGIGPHGAQTFSDRSDCFGVRYLGYIAEEVGYSLQFGGPGGSCGN